MRGILQNELEPKSGIVLGEPWSAVSTVPRSGRKRKYREKLFYSKTVFKQLTVTGMDSTLRNSW